MSLKRTGIKYRLETDATVRSPNNGGGIPAAEGTVAGDLEGAAS
jgi:hypothetical protein